MKYITIDETRKQIGSHFGYAGKNTKGAIKVDCASPSKNHTLKTDYKRFKGENQWQLDTVKKAKHDRKVKLQAKHAKALNRLVWMEVKKDKDLNAEDLAEIDEILNT